MRKLIYIPVIHTEADMGSMAKQLYHQKLPVTAEKKRLLHVETVNGFWNSIEIYLNHFQIPENGLKIFQDGMFAEGKMAMTILEEGIKSGSKNSVIVQNLIKQGATLIKTEDFTLVKEEYDQIQLILKAKNQFLRYFHLLKYKLLKSHFLMKRDKFISAAINEALKPGETGILFIGAYHNIKNRLPSDIEIIELKEPQKVRKYIHAIRLQRNPLDYILLSYYLKSPCTSFNNI